MSHDPIKNIVICIDGTGDWAGKNQTHVAEIFDLLSKDQRRYYDGGVGTLSDASVLVGINRTFLKLLDLATATSLRLNVLRAYEYLVDNYKPDDQIYLFGFSRGAFACRLLAALVHSFGILRPEHKNLIPYLWQSISSASANIEGFFDESDRIKLKFAVAERDGTHDSQIHFMGLFDTVSSVGVLDRFKVFPFTDRNPAVRIIRHAVSLRESRNAFLELLIQPDTKSAQDVLEVWFEGVHRDVGGGSEIGSRSNSQESTLQWMLGEAKDAGLSFAAPPRADSLPMKVPLFDPYVFVGLYPMTIFDHSLIPEKKWKKDHTRVPANLSLWLLLKLPLGVVSNGIKRLTGDGEKLPEVWPRDSFFRWYWPNFKHFRPIPLGAFVCHEGSIREASTRQMSIWETFKSYLRNGKRPVVGPLHPVQSPPPRNSISPEFPKVKLNFPDFVGIMLGVTFAFLILNRGVPWTWDFAKPFGESWSQSLFGWQSSTWAIALFGGFVLQQGFAQWLDQHLVGRLLNTLVPLIGIAAAVAVFASTKDQAALLYGGGLGFLLALAALLGIGKEVVRADRVVALCFVPWFLIMAGAWVFLRLLVPGAVGICNWLTGNDFEFHAEAGTYASAWILAAISYVFAIINVIQDRIKKRRL